MKKILLSAALMVAAVSFANAQWFVGGELGFKTSNKEYIDLNVDGLLNTLDLGVEVGTDLPIPLDLFGYFGMEDVKLKTTSYTVLPKIGYIFNDNWMVGLGIGYSSTSNTIEVEGDELGKLTPGTFYANPFVRYTAWEVGSFSLAFQADVNLGFGNTKLEANDVELLKLKTSSYGVNITPVVQFDLSCNVMLESRFNFASLGYNASKAEYEPAEDEKVEYKNNEFNFGVDGNNAFTTGAITVGFIVKF